MTTEPQTQTPKTENPEPETAFPTPPSFPEPKTSGAVLATEDPIDMFITGKRRPASFALAAEPAPPVSEEPGLCDYTGNDLFLMTHGYRKDNPPKHIPNRRLDEDVRGFSLLREIKKFF